MSHGITAQDDMISTNAMPWHGLGQRSDHLMTVEEVVEGDGVLAWTVSKKQLAVPMGDGSFAPMQDWVATVRDSDNLPLGAVKPGYTVIQNSELAEFQRALLEVEGGMIETAGSLFGGKVVWFLSHIPADIDLGDAGKIKAYQLLASSHNATLPVFLKNTPVRVECANTLDMARTGTGNSFKFKHTTEWRAKMEQARAALGITKKYLASFEKTAKVLIAKKVTYQDLLAMTSELFPFAGDPDKVPTRTQNRRDAVLSMLAGDNLQNTKGTAWQWYNAVAEYVDHKGTFRETEGGSREDNRALSILTGQASLVKDQALKIALAS